MSTYLDKNWTLTKQENREYLSQDFKAVYESAYS